MTTQCFGYHRNNVQEGKPLHNHLSKLGYKSQSGSNGIEYLGDSNVEKQIQNR